MFGKIRTAVSLRNTFDNWVTVLAKTKKSEFPISARLRDGTTTKIFNRHDLVFLSDKNTTGMTIDSKEHLHVPLEGKSLVFEGWRYNGDIISIFSKSVYEKLDVKNKTVFDIGANIGDSSMYFAVKGASKVIAVEPVPANYEVLLRNINLNKLQNIAPMMCGIGGHAETIKIKKNFFSNGILEYDKQGDEIEIITLDSLLEKFPSESPVLKMDCEGYEYEIIKNSKDLDKFSQIVMEFHLKEMSQLEEIKEKMKDFDVMAEKTGFSNEYHIGSLFAKKK